jgi:hypothetical protein
MQKRRFAIADTRAPVTATPLSVVLKFGIYTRRRNQILLVGHHQGACRLISAGLHRIESVVIAQRTYIDVGWSISYQSGDVHDSLPSTSLPNSLRNPLGSTT